jgi:hypothetical protein
MKVSDAIPPQDTVSRAHVSLRPGHRVSLIELRVRLVKRLKLGPARILFLKFNISKSKPFQTTVTLTGWFDMCAGLAISLAYGSSSTK